MRLYLFLFVILLGCTSARQPVAQPSSTLVIHADTDFTTSERIVIHRATESLMWQVGLRVEVIYDLDFRKVERLSSLRYEPRLIRVTSQSELTIGIDRHFNGTVFGWTTQNSTPSVYIVVDRLYGEGLALHVYLHELLHAFGADHVDDPGAVMYWRTDLSHKAVILNESDRNALARANDAKAVSHLSTK